MLQRPDKLWPYEPLGSCDDLSYLISLFTNLKSCQLTTLVSKVSNYMYCTRVAYSARRLVSKRALANKGMCNL